MKKLLLLTLVFSFSLKTKAQIVFCPPGASWNYRFSNGFGPTIKNESIKYTRDSLVDGTTVKVLSHKIFFSSYAEHGNPTLIKQVGDTVFMRNARTLHAWQVLYNFNAVPGQSWYNSLLVGQTTNSAIINYTTTVDSGLLVVENGVPLKKLVVKHSSTYGGGEARSSITERFGSNIFLFNFANRAWSDGDFVTGFLCYSDLSFGTKQFTSLPCDFSNLVGLESINASLENIKVYPNPVSDVLNLEFENTFHQAELSIMDAQGREVTHCALQQKNRIDLTDLAKGIYFISVSDDGRLIFKSKLVKTE